MTTRADIEDFLRLQRFAIVGVSRDPKDFSRGLLRELCDRGYDVVPVNLYADVIDGLECFQCLQTVKPAVEGAFADDVTAGDGTRGARLCRGRRSPGVDVSRRRTRRS